MLKRPVRALGANNSRPQLAAERWGIGVGRLGAMLSQYGRAFRMRVLARNPFKQTAEALG